MKSSLLCLLLTFGTTMGAGAQSLDYLTVRTADGQEHSLPADGLKITFGNGSFTATAPGATLTLPLAGLGSMFFAQQPTSVAVPTAGEATDANIRNGRLTVTAQAGTCIRIYTADGRLSDAHVQTVTGTESHGGHFTAGIHIVKMNGKTFKLLAR